jgi:hypothetical protein
MPTAVGAGSLVRLGLAVNAAPESLPAVGSDTFRTIGYLAPGFTAPSFVKKTIEEVTLNDGTLQAGAGLEAQELQFSYVRNFGDVAHEDTFSDGRNIVNQYRNWRIQFSDSGQEIWDFRGFVSTFEKQELTAEQLVKVNVSVKVYGNITVTP